MTDADLERLNVRARGLMTGLSGELQQAQVMLQRPPPPAPPRGRGLIQQRSNPDHGSSGAAPIIPPIVAGADQRLSPHSSADARDANAAWLSHTVESRRSGRS